MTESRITREGQNWGLKLSSTCVYRGQRSFDNDFKQLKSEQCDAKEVFVNNIYREAEHRVPTHFHRQRTLQWFYHENFPWLLASNLKLSNIEYQGLCQIIQKCYCAKMCYLPILPCVVTTVPERGGREWITLWQNTTHKNNIKHMF